MRGWRLTAWPMARPTGMQIKIYDKHVGRVLCSGVENELRTKYVDPYSEETGCKSQTILKQLNIARPLHNQ
jgi:hypothetical protein